jgi:hypothetical protein
MPISVIATQRDPLLRRKGIRAAARTSAKSVLEAGRGQLRIRQKPEHREPTKVMKHTLGKERLRQRA